MSRKKPEPAAPPQAGLIIRNVRDLTPSDPCPIESQASLVVTILAAPEGAATRQMILSVQGDPKFRTNEALGWAESLARAVRTFGQQAEAAAAGPAAPGEGPPCADPTPSTTP